MENQIIKTEKDSVTHFNECLKLLVEKYQPTRIISFGKQSLQNKNKGCFVNSKTEVKHYCLLICMESCTRIDYEIQDFINHHYQDGQITIVCHGENSIMEQLEANNRFFITVLSKGKYLYSKSGFIENQLPPKYNPLNALEKAEKHFNHRIFLAKGFFDCARESQCRGNYMITAFSLHQAVEQSCILLIKIHLDYRSEFHNLFRLLGLCRSFSDEPYNVLVGERPSSQRLFNILIRSYGKARYSLDFDVSQKDAEALCEKVSCFIDLVESMCRTQMEKLAELKSSE
ncbi:MAG: HEPN domain-containing protein [Cecembia sp.]